MTEQKLKLPVEHIVVGNFIWYGGNTSMFGWNCPAKIVEIKDGEFTVMSLDDMKVQSQTYRIVMGDHEPESRKSMRAITKDEAAEYMAANLTEQKKRLLDIEAAYERKKREANKTIEAIEKELV